MNLRFSDFKQVSENLITRGFAPPVANAKAELFARSADALAAAGTTGPCRAYYVPGRIEVLGKHTDYAGGSSMVTAVERGFCLVASARSSCSSEVV